MKWLTLPDAIPYREMIAFFHPLNVELWVNGESFNACSVVGRTLIDCLSDAVNAEQAGMFVFWFSPKGWEQLCSALHELHHDAHPLSGPHRPALASEDRPKDHRGRKQRSDRGDHPNGHISAEPGKPQSNGKMPAEGTLKLFRPTLGPEGSDF